MLRTFSRAQRSQVQTRWPLSTATDHVTGTGPGAVVPQTEQIAGADVMARDRSGRESRRSAVRG
jgi:hypothetical protein